MKDMIPILVVNVSLQITKRHKVEFLRVEDFHHSKSIEQAKLFHSSIIRSYEPYKNI